MDSVTSNGHPALQRVAIVLFMIASTPCILVLNVALVAVIVALSLLYAGMKIGIKGILLPFGRWMRSVWTRIRTIPDFRAGFRNGIAVAFLAAVLVMVVGGGLGPAVNGVGVWISSLFQASTSGSSLSGAAIHGDITNGCNEACQAKIAARRAKIVGIDAAELPYIKARLHEEYASDPSGRGWNDRLVQTCVANYPIFEKANDYTAFPASLLAGKAYVESAGCVFAKTRDGGKGPMQITTPEKWHEKAVAAMVHEDTGWVHKAWRGESGDPNWDYWTNVLMGAVMLSGYEEQFNSRGVGIFAYNSGPGAARKYMRNAGISSFENHTISQFRGVIPEGFKDGSRPRIYLPRILAGAVMVDRAHRGLPVTDGDWIDELTLADIPGADPRKDSVR